MKELIKQLNDLKIKQTSIDWAENIPYQIWKDHIDGRYKSMRSGLEVDTHRWYETSISVIELDGELIGIKHITNLFSESSSCEDCFVTMEFYEMEPVNIISYVRKS